MLVKLNINFGGRETGERRYEAGSVVDLDEGLALRLIAGRQAEVVEEAPELAPEMVAGPAAEAVEEAGGQPEVAPAPKREKASRKGGRK